MSEPAGAKQRRLDPLTTPSDFTPKAVAEISGALTLLLADMFALYLKTNCALAARSRQ